MSESNSEKPQNNRLTPTQARALDLTQNISVTAGAGSGKTFILVSRYLKLVLDEKVDVRSVLAITFTDKAAAEMKERVAKSIDNLLAENPPATQRYRLLEVRERMNAAQISTIHSFCSRLLREFAVESGVDPDFSLLTDLQGVLLLEECLNETIEVLDKQQLESEITAEEWRDFLREIGLYRLRKMLKALLKQPYEVQRLQQLITENNAENALQRLMNVFYEILEQYINPDSFAENVLSQFRLILSLDADVENLKENGITLFQKMAEAIQIFDNANDRNRFWQLMITISILATTQSGTAFKSPTSIGKKADLSDAYEEIKTLSEFILPLRNFAMEISEFAPGFRDEVALRNQHLILTVLADTAERYRSKKSERGQLDFEDLQLLTLNMLREHPQVCSKLRSRYRNIMVDEFQDTNSLQWEIVRRMGELDGKLDTDRFFIVGDPKQSIYGFRNADVRVFQHVKDVFQKAYSKTDEFNGNIVLTDSFRFLPSINRFTNYLFEQVLGDENNHYDVDFEPLQTQRSAEDIANIEIANFDAAELTANQQSQETYIAQRICDLLNLDILNPNNETPLPQPNRSIFRREGNTEFAQNVRPGDIAILIETRTKLNELESALRRFGVPFKTVGGIGFYSRQEIYDVYHLLRFLDNPSDDLALIALLRSPFAAISDAALYWLVQEKGKTYLDKLSNIKNLENYPIEDQSRIALFAKQISRWQKRRDRLSLSRLVDEIFEESMYRATISAEWNGEQMNGNLDKMLEQIRETEQRGFVSLADFIEALSQTIKLDPREGEAQLDLEDENTVKIMTIHQSKGLEFPIVFCAHLEKTSGSPRNYVCFDSEIGLAEKYMLPETGYSQESSFLYDYISFRSKQKDFAEKKRLFYVAVTRARDHLFLCGETKKGEAPTGSPLAWLEPILENSDLVSGQDAHEMRYISKADVTFRYIKHLPNVLPQPRSRVDILPNLEKIRSFLNEPLSDESLPTHLQKIHDVPKGETFSATQLLTFKKDAEAYFLRYHRGFFESDYEFLTQFAEQDALSLLKGKIIHKILENGLPADKGEVLAALDDAFFQYEIFDTEERAKFIDEIPGLMLPFIESEYANTIFAATEAETEIKLTMRLGNDFFIGMLDRIYKNADDEWVVVDYKTNNISAAQTKKVAEEYSMQIEGYALLLAQLFPNQQNYAIQLYFLKPQQLFERIFTTDEITQIRQNFLNTITQIKQFYPFGDIIPE